VKGQSRTSDKVGERRVFSRSLKKEGIMWGGRRSRLRKWGACKRRVLKMRKKKEVTRYLGTGNMKQAMY